MQPSLCLLKVAKVGRGVRGDRGPTRCSMSRWLNVVDGVKGSSGRGDMAAASPRCFRNSSLGWQLRINAGPRQHSANKALS